MRRGRLLVILGMHRSGTSAFSRALTSLNVNLGSNIMAPHPVVNPKGFWEDQDIYELNEEVLAILDCKWDHFASISASHVATIRQSGLVDRAKRLLRLKVDETANSLFAFKDPRTARLILFWREVFAGESYEVSYLLVYRNPLSVAKSLEKRDGFALTKSYLLWLLHVVPSLLETSELPRLLLNFDELLDTPEAVLSSIGVKFNLSINEAALKEYVNAFLAPDLRHTQYALEDLQQEPNCPDLVLKLQRLLNEVSMGSRDLDSSETRHLIQQFNVEMWRLAPLLDLLDKKYQQYTDLAATVLNKDTDLNQMKGVIEDQSQQYEALSAKFVALEQQLESLQNDFVIFEKRTRIIKNELLNVERQNVDLKDYLARETHSLQMTQAKLAHSLQTFEELSLRFEKAQQQRALSNRQIEFANETIATYNKVISQIVQTNQELRSACASLTSRVQSKHWLKRIVMSLNRLLFSRMSVVTKEADVSVLPLDFDPVVYLKLNSDVALAGVDPHAHYLLHGSIEARRYKEAVA